MYIANRNIQGVIFIITCTNRDCRFVTFKDNWNKHRSVSGWVFSNNILDKWSDVELWDLNINDILLVSMPILQTSYLGIAIHHWSWIHDMVHSPSGLWNLDWQACCAPLYGDRSTIHQIHFPSMLGLHGCWVIRHCTTSKNFSMEHRPMVWHQLSCIDCCGLGMGVGRGAGEGLLPKGQVAGWYCPWTSVHGNRETQQSWNLPDQ